MTDFFLRVAFALNFLFLEFKTFESQLFCKPLLSSFVSFDRDHSFSMYAEFSEKLTLLTP